ncbi:MAG TPA: glycosyltransferase family 9 protein [Bacteroidota bacterium]|nr:glycosyltransferase family 9 protein [Bacteroidota bacterium]
MCMQTAEHITQTRSDPAVAIEPEELEHIAFIGQSEMAHGIFRSLAPHQRVLFANRYVLSEVIVAGVRKLRTFLAASAEESARDEKAFVSETLDLFIAHSRGSGTTPRELFDSILLWSDELVRLSLLREALRYYDEALSLGINRFPELYVRCLMGKGNVLNMMGKYRETESLLASLASRPYIITDRNLIPDLLFQLGQESLLRGEVAFYKRVLFRALRHFSTHLPARERITRQITATYRQGFRVLLDGELSITDRTLYGAHRLFFFVLQSRLANIARLSELARTALLGYLYALNYRRRTSVELPPGRFSSTGGSVRSRDRKHILITRAMGGIGDLLMMTPGLHAMKRKHPHREIHLAVPRRFFPLFAGNTDVRLVDIDDVKLDPTLYKRWLNFTDCPAARVEARTAPRVKRSRIELFARAMGVGPLALRRMDKRPRYFLTPEDRAFQHAFWREHNLNGKIVIGVQLHADEVYRDYPHMKPLVHRLAEQYEVLVFDSEKIFGLDNERVIRIEGYPLRKAFALAGACNAIVAPDSAFVHLAAALDVPCVALYGPVDGKVRTKHYPKCIFLDVRKKLGCLPCWRNDRIPCKLTGLRPSVCLADISLQEILNTLSRVLEKEKRHGRSE